MSGETIHVEGLAELQKSLGFVSKELPIEVKAVAYESALLVARAANSYVPVQSGKLAASIRARSSLTGASVTAGSASVPYAAPIHWGWGRHHIKATKFLVRALDQCRPAVVHLFETRVKRILDRIR